jgi:5'-nucleotidase
LGFVTVAAPRDQCSGSGRSMPPTSDGAIRLERVSVGGQVWEVYAVGGSPAQAVQHAILELMPRRPDLVVAGINYGENVGTGVTISGTVGAALEGAAFGIPALAVSLETEARFHLSHSTDIDFSAAAHFAATFGRMLLAGEKMADVDVLKVEVPSDATPETAWTVTRLSRAKYYVPVTPQRRRLDEPGTVGYEVISDSKGLEPDSDAYALRVARKVAVTPLSLDLTSRVDIAELEPRLRGMMDSG